jgi:hypothetical protein
MTCSDSRVGSVAKQRTGFAEKVVVSTRRGWLLVGGVDCRPT